MVIIDAERCTACGTCVKVCHEHCMTLVDGRLVIDYGSCSTCTQCIAICPRKALSWDGILPEDFDPASMPSARQVDELLQERRTIRQFAEAPLARETLEEIVSRGIYAPTHNFDLRCILIDDPELIRAFDRAAFQFSSRILKFLFRPWPVRALLAVAPRSLRDEYAKALPKLELAVKRGRGYDCAPPALVCVVADGRVPLSLESAQYALYAMTLSAQVRGVACRNLVGNQMIFNRNREIRRGLGLKRHERIVAVAGFGWPAVHFKGKVLGKRMQLQWNGAGPAASASPGAS